MATELEFLEYGDIVQVDICEFEIDKGKVIAFNIDGRVLVELDNGIEVQEFPSNLTKLDEEGNEDYD